MIKWLIHPLMKVCLDLLYDKPHDLANSYNKVYGNGCCKKGHYIKLIKYDPSLKAYNCEDQIPNSSQT